MIFLYIFGILCLRTGRKLFFKPTISEKYRIYGKAPFTGSANNIIISLGQQYFYSYVFCFYLVFFYCHSRGLGRILENI